MQETSVKEVLHHHRHATDAVDVGHVVFAGGFCIGDVWNFLGDAIEVIK
jgi:phosphoribosylformylglycinamidine (FGAM) synthase-like amidotransferase family enzyme